jgi:molecular chaperone GrpE
VTDQNDSNSDADRSAPSNGEADAPSGQSSAGGSDTAQNEVAKLRDQLLRTAADFDNYRKRTRREIADAERRSKEDLLREILPVFDNLERAALHAEAATDVQALADGLRLVMRQFADTLGKLSIERIATKGLAFDPTVHEAIQQVETSEVPPGAIASEIQAGYRLGDRVIRPALVVVAKPPASR